MFRAISRRLARTGAVVTGVVFVSLAGAAPAAADLCVTSLGTADVLRYDEASGTPAGVCATGGGLVDPRGLTFGPDGNLYVSDHARHSILRFDGNTGAFIDVFVTSGSGGLFEPQGLAFGPDGNLYVVNFLSVRRYDGATGAFLDIFASPVIGGPTDVVFGSDEDLYVTTIFQVQRFDGETGQVLDVFAQGGSGSAFFTLAFDLDGDLYVSDNLGNEVSRFDGDTGSKVASFRVCVAPLGIAFGPDGMLYASCGRDRIVRINPSTGALIDTFVSPGSGGLTVPLFLAFTPANDVAAQLAELHTAVVGLGPGTSLADKVAQAQTYLKEDKVSGACSVLQAFINQVRALAGKKIPTEIAPGLIEDAARIRSALSCSTGSE